MEALKKEVLIGLIIGIISNVAGSYLYIYFFSSFNLEETINKAIEAGVVSLIKEGAELDLWKFGPTVEEMSLEAEKQMTEELDKMDKESKEKLKIEEERKELDKLKKLNDELLKEESTDEKDDKVSANPDSNNVHG